VEDCILLRLYTIKHDNHVTLLATIYSRAIEDTLSILHREKKCILLNTLEQFHIHKLTKENLQLNDTYTDTYNPIFDLIIKHNK
jgi:hypothetical protein